MKQGIPANSPVLFPSSQQGSGTSQYTAGLRAQLCLLQHPHCQQQHLLYHWLWQLLLGLLSCKATVWCSAPFLSKLHVVDSPVLEFCTACRESEALQALLWDRGKQRHCSLKIS